MSELSIRLRPLTEDDLDMFRRFATEPGLIGPDWGGFRDPEAAARRFATDHFLGEKDSRLMVEVTADDETAAAGFVTWFETGWSIGKHWEIGIALLPEWRRRGIGWRAQDMLCDYLFTHTPVHRIAAMTAPDNLAEQKALERAGFQREGVLRGFDWHDGRWEDCVQYARLRTD